MSIIRDHIVSMKAVDFKPEYQIKRIPGNVDIAAKDDVFYFDNYNDLVAVRITSGNQVEVLKRIEDVLPAGNNFPPGNDVYFECVDARKGVVTGWEATILVSPKCYR